MLCSASFQSQQRRDETDRRFTDFKVYLFHFNQIFHYWSRIIEGFSAFSKIKKMIVTLGNLLGLTKMLNCIFISCITCYSRSNKPNS